MFKTVHKDQRYKLTLCHTFKESNQCKANERCWYAHGNGELRIQGNPLTIEQTILVVEEVIAAMKNQTSKEERKVKKQQDYIEKKMEAEREATRKEHEKMLE